jgi:hypothetical protein
LSNKNISRLSGGHEAGIAPTGVVAARTTALVDDEIEEFFMAWRRAR